MHVSPLSIALCLFVALPLAAAVPLPQAPDGKAGAPSAAPPQEPQADGGIAMADYHPVVDGTVKLGKVAELRLTDGWSYLDGADGRRFLVDLGNSPDQSVLGVAVAPDHEETGVFAVFFYEDDGHVDDDETPDYDELLVQMKESAVEESKERRQAGLEGVALLGWAEPPHYDRAAHKLYWAERLQFEGSKGETLNYNVRVLGRAGHLVVRGVGSIGLLDVVAAHSKHLLECADFIAGQRYQDFDPAYDKVAAYGIGALVAGKVALKVGLFAKLALLLKGLIKPILAGIVLLGVGLAKLFGRKKRGEAPPAPAA
jgi:uncharacterized membrane-anchored protein